MTLLCATAERLYAWAKEARLAGEPERSAFFVYHAGIAQWGLDDEEPEDDEDSKDHPHQQL